MKGVGQGSGAAGAEEAEADATSQQSDRREQGGQPASNKVTPVSTAPKQPAVAQRSWTAVCNPFTPKTPPPPKGKSLPPQAPSRPPVLLSSQNNAQRP